MSYDQWKTASPYDDEPDWIEIAEKWLKRQPKPECEEDAELITMVEGLLEFIDNEI